MQGDDRLPFLYEGEVTRRDDPDGLGRVKILIPGVVEPETPNWAWPMAAPGSGSAQRGTFEPPAVGANVLVLFKLGERDYPYYMTGPWGEPGGVSDVPTNAEVEDDDRQNAVTEDEEWRIERDSRAGEKRFTTTHRTSDLRLVLEAAAGADNATLQTDAGPKVELKGTAQEANLDSGFGPALLLNAVSQTVALKLGSGPKLELFAGGFALSAGSAPEFAAVGGKAKVGDRNATEKMMLGTAYRVDETTFLNTLTTALQVFATACKASATDPTLVAAATALELVLLAPPVVDSPVRTTAAHAGYLSQNVDVQG